MATSEIDICNRALAKLGAARIGALSDDSRNAALMAAAFAPARDHLLRTHLWNFAIRRRQLARLAEPPTFGWAHAYAKPEDWLRTLGVHGSGRAEIAHADEAGRILADAEAVGLRYVARVEEAAAFDAHFAEALACRLAAELAVAITQSSTLKQLLDAEFDRTLRQARAIDALDDMPPAMPEGSWVTCRY